MNTFSKALLTMTVALTAVSINTRAQDVATVVDRPTVGQQANYTGFRAPLHGGRLLKLPVGSVQPRGWLREYLVRQSKGLCGQLGTVSAWLDKKGNQWLSDTGDHGWEEVPYWLKGYSDLAYILGDEAMLNETRTWIEAVFKSQAEDGSFGPVNMRNGKRELWAQMIMLTTIPDDQFLEDYWENSRGGDNLYSVLWLYNRTGDAFLLDLAKKVHQNTANWCQATNLPNWHNVNIAECFREPATYYMLSGDEKHLQATYNDQHLIRRTFGQVPGGMFGGDENCRLGYIDPRQGVETCGMVEQMASDEILLRFTGDTYWADNCEDVAFNTYPAAVMPDFKALRYITSPNMVLSDSKNHAPGIQNSGPFLSMNPFSSRCCQHNHSQGWPYYAEHLVMATP